MITSLVMVRSLVMLISFVIIRSLVQVQFLDVPSSVGNSTFVPLEQETGSNFKYTAFGYIPDYPGYISRK